MFSACSILSLLPLRIFGEVRILRELRQKRRLWRRHQPPVQGDAVQNADDALRHRAQIVQRLGLEGDMAERLPPVLVGPFVIALQHRLAGLQRQHRVQSPQQARAKSRIEPLADIAGESQAAQIRVWENSVGTSSGLCWVMLIASDLALSRRHAVPMAGKRERHSLRTQRPGKRVLPALRPQAYGI